MKWGVELELLVGDDLTLSVVLVGKDTVLQDDNRSVGARGSFFEFLCSSLQEAALGGGGSIDGADLKGAREVLRASRWCLGGDRGREGENSYSVLHGVFGDASRGSSEVNKKRGRLVRYKDEAEAIYAAGSE